MLDTNSKGICFAHCLFRLLGDTNAPIRRFNLLNRLQRKHRWRS